MLENGGLAVTEPTRVVSSLDLRPVESFTRRGTVIRADLAPTVGHQLQVLARLLWAGARGRSLVLFSNWGSLKPDLVAAGLLSLLPHRPPVVMVGEVWNRSPGLRGRLGACLVRFGFRGIDRMLTTSQGEADLLPRVWGVPAGKAGVARFYYYPPQHGSDVDTERGDVVFAAGDTARDYGPLLELARERPGLRFRLATTVLEGASLPPNVELLPVRLDGYRQAMAGAGVVVVPIAPGLRRSAGLLTFLMAMYQCKPTVVTWCLSALDYIDDGRTGLIVDGSLEQYREAVDWALDPANEAEVRRMGRAAHEEVATRYTFQSYVDTILAELDAVPARRPSAVRRGRVRRRPSGRPGR